MDPGHAREICRTQCDERQHHVDAQLPLLLPVDVVEGQQQRVLVEDEREGDAVADTEPFPATPWLAEDGDRAREPEQDQPEQVVMHVMAGNADRRALAAVLAVNGDQPRDGPGDEEREPGEERRLTRVGQRVPHIEQ